MHTQRPQSTRDAAGAAPVVVCAVADPAAEGHVASVAVWLVARLGGRLLLLYVQPAPLLAAEPQIVYAAPGLDDPLEPRDAVRRLAALAATAGVAARTELRIAAGDAEQLVRRVAREQGAALVVVGPGGTGGGGLARTIAGAPCPVLVVPAEAAPAGARAVADWGREPMAAERGPRDDASVTPTEGGNVTGAIVCGVDGSRNARTALRAAAWLADELDTRLVLAHVVHAAVGSHGLGFADGPLVGATIEAGLAAGTRLLDEIAEAEGVADAEKRVVLGFPGDRLADLADEEGAALIVVGSRGRGALRAAFLGSVSTDVIAVARCPVLVVPPGAATAEDDEPALAAAAGSRR